MRGIGMTSSRTAQARRYVTGWALDREERQQLLSRFTPSYPDVVADHVTLDTDIGEDHPLPSETAGKIVGHVDDQAGVQALVVRVGGTTDRPDGSTYHITWSLDRRRGRKAVHSNDVIRQRGWEPLSAVPIQLVPTRFPF